MRFGLYTAEAAAYTDYRGSDEKYFVSSNGSNAAFGGWYILMPSGELRSWNGVSLATSPAVATLPEETYNQTHLLYATQGQVPAFSTSVTSDGKVTLTREAAFTGDVRVEYSRGDGARKTTQTFRYSLTDY